MSSLILRAGDVRTILPLQPPFLMLDRVEARGGAYRGTKSVSVDEPHFAGHFPGQPIMPGVLQVEAMCQLAQLAYVHGGRGPRCPYLAGLDRVKFRRPVRPGDRLLIEAEAGEQDAAGFAVKARTSVGGEVTCQAGLRFSLEAPVPVAPEQLDPRPFEPPPEAEECDIVSVLGLIPHRFPFLLVDRVYRPASQDRAKQTGIVGVKNVSINEPAMMCQRSASPWMPNSLLPEICAQVCCVYALGRDQYRGLSPYFMSIDTAEFVAPVLAGDRLCVEITPAVMKERFGTATGRVTVAGAEVMTCEMKFAFVTP